MKRYKLLKDTPTAAEGTVCTSEASSPHIILDPFGVEYDVAKIDNFNEWFEEIKEYKRWRAKRGERYWFARALGVNSDKEVNHYIDRGRWETGNYFKTEEEAELYGRKLIANQKLIDTAKKAWFEFNGSDGPNWKNGSQRKHSIYYSYASGDMCLDYTWSAQEMMGVYFPTEDSAQWVIDNMRDDLKLIFGVK